MGKKTAWNAWDIYGDVTDAFVYLASHPFETLTVDSDHFQKPERLAVVMYDKTSSLNSVNDARQELFCLRSRGMDRIPPTQDALLQHAKRAVFQAGIWTTSTQA